MHRTPRNFPSRMLAPRPPGITNANSNADTAPHHPAKRRRIACQRCRQAKLRCVSSNGQGQPCQRCVEQSYPCRMDARHDHVSKTTTSNALANHVNLLSSTITASDTNTRVVTSEIPPVLQQPSPPAALVSASTHLSQTTTSPDITVTGLSPGYSQNEEQQESRQQSYSTTTTRSLNSVTLDPEQIQLYFSIYFTHYHPLFPILPTNIAPDAVYKACPFLFWTIVTTAARHDDSDFSIFPSLLPTLKGLLWSTVAVVPHTLPALQAMAILCVWPFPESSMPTDSTFMLAGVLKSAAMHAGLHRPDVLTHYSRVRLSLGTQEIREAVRVWCCVYIAIESAAVANGHPPSIISDRIIEQASNASNPFALPKALHQLLLVQMYCNKVHAAMSDLERSTASVPQVSRTSLLNLLKVDLQTLENMLGNEISDWTRLLLCSAAFQLQAFWIFEDEETILRRDGTIKAYETAVQFIAQAQTFSLSAKELPFHLVRIGITAAIFISKICHSSYSSIVDYARGKSAFNAYVSIAKQACVQDNDMSGRATKVLPQLWTIHFELHQQAPTPPQITLKSRLFLSITLDGLWQWREKFSFAPNNGAPSLPPHLMSRGLTATSEGSVQCNQSSTSHPMNNHANVVSVQTGNDTSSMPSMASAQLNLAVDGSASNSTTIDISEREGFMDSPVSGELDPNSIQFDLLYPDTLTEFLDMAWLYEGGAEPS